jgi:2-polyprenyl-3-methyl-5-hydroxy-6-metoxy-1,4-benzoquinol methylase
MVPAPASAAQGQDAIVWEEVACPLCAAVDEEVLLAVLAEGEPALYRLVSCRRCGMHYLNPRPDEASIGRFYPADYEPYQPPQKSFTSWRARLRRYLKRISMAHLYGDPPRLKHWYQRALAAAAAPWFRPSRDSLTALPYHGRGRLLDFGCGSGWYLHRMRERGWDVTGIDFSEHAAGGVRQHFGLPVLVGSLPHPEVAPESFDVITMGCVLEHVHDPHRVVGAAAEALRPGGLLVISVPNIDSWGFRYFGEDWWSLELPRHLLHFTPPTLRRLVESHGLEVQEQRMMARGSWMRRSLEITRRREDQPVGRRLLGRLGRWRVVSSSLTRWTVCTRQSDCIMVIARRPETPAGSAFTAAPRAA